jgi:hypothetical protein
MYHCRVLQMLTQLLIVVDWGRRLDASYSDVCIPTSNWNIICSDHNKLYLWCDVVIYCRSEQFLFSSHVS